MTTPNDDADDSPPVTAEDLALADARFAEELRQTLQTKMAGRNGRSFAPGAKTP